ncbi:hypothetical protein U732_1344 [Clostridium argentinense CDC 2741]|uniref:Uncharacterized protein n=1 Tax=Clostridium argentinense CDC 2741 TaxID=1418104 RepID=A0A0C1U5J6_9CLOT|nr:hypothetical protein [Clostridium argentinense]ARC85444.1 hypothetical protein RSJ17_13510 [Clostridium argentinense]KIE46978.1 hypothetical protein U732_1344 [Clostridium argentinense CDC 2741]NFF41261.1 hypothetical protein [Clostridium argentinense]NFP52321.1 hypothetical protein [Clostridium argentinense]NFP71988.1 hypothetical protein [Clostridium argentinense]
MSKLYYCVDCKRLIKSSEKCDYCNGSFLKAITNGTPVNVIGTKQKGKVLKVEDSTVKLIVIDEAKNKLIKEYKAEQLRKVL